ncbi:hypothetical protein GLYMA_12G147500v4 [Glycine max]|nr:hypothetical protein GLYMA_12G147500v4 [Glycine max]KAH1143232.1 hypothetical protein GYH30_033769 [Glycine max]
MMETGDISQPEPPKQVWCEEKQASVHEEIKRMNQLPANSSYVTHRLKVLNKILQLMSVQNCIPRAGVGVAFCRAFFVKVVLLAMPLTLVDLHLEGQKIKNKACLQFVCIGI